jgi:dienelactone hydrolase
MAGRAGTAVRVIGAGAVLGVLLAIVPPAGSPATAGAAVTRVTPAPAVGVRTERFVDRSRKTPADVSAGIAPAPTRTLATTIYYPARGAATGLPDAPVENARAARGRYPLVLFSPGSPGTPADYVVLLADWAAHGYVVAAPTFPVSSVAGPDAAAWADLPAQTKDARFVLGKVLALDPAKAGIPEVDGDHIAVAGHSFGGATALSLVARCCRDDRVDAAVILAGVTETVDGPALRGVRGPVLFVHARGDRLVPYAPALKACTRAGTPKRMLTVEEIRGPRAHVVPYLGQDDPYSAVVRPAIVDFLDGYLRDRLPARARLDRAGRGTTVGAVTRCRPGEATTPGTTLGTTPAG